MTRDAQVFQYVTPSTDFERGRKVVTLCETDRISCGVLVIKEGGETRLHSHNHLDGVWMVLSGRARFYGDGDELIGEFGKHEGVLVPRDFKYWFEAVDGDQEPLELMRIEAADIALEKFFSGKSKNIIERIDGTVRTVAG